MYADLNGELARLHVEDLLREACRLRRPRAERRETPATGGRIGCLPAAGDA
jgi:hypothetical protein